MRFKSIFKKLLVYNIGIILVGLCLFALLINYSMQQLLIEKKQSTLYHQGEQILKYLQQTDALSNDQGLQTNLMLYKKLTHTGVDFLLLDGKHDQRKIIKQKDKLLKKSDIKDPQIIDNILKGNKIRHVGPFKKTSHKKLLTVGMPIRDQDKIIGALFLHTPVQEIQIGEVSKILLIVLLIIVTLSIIALYWITRKISRPLIRMSAATRLIGNGNFKERILVESEDEVGQLAFTFNQMVEKLERLDQARKELIMNVSHELRTPLTSVRGFIQGMVEGVIPSHQHQRYMEICYREIQRLSTLLNTMLDLSAIESGQMTLKPVVIRLEPLIDSVLDSVKVRLEDKNVTLNIKGADDGSLTVYADPERLKQILFNLLDNAIRHTPEGGRISIDSKRSNQEFELTVSDTGSGIEPQSLPHIWERFYTEDSSRQSHRERSGLGLTITKELIEQMGGRITVDSTVGKGTTFILNLPVSKAQTD